MGEGNNVCMPLPIMCHFLLAEYLWCKLESESKAGLSVINAMDMLEISMKLFEKSIRKKVISDGYGEGTVQLQIKMSFDQNPISFDFCFV